MGAAVIAASGLVVRRRFGLAFLLTAAIFSGTAGVARSSPILPPSASGAVSFVGRVVTDPAPVTSGWAFVVAPITGELAAVRLAVSGHEPFPVAVGSTVAVNGRLSAHTGRLHRSPISGWVASRGVSELSGPHGLMALADALRSRVSTSFRSTAAGGLMRGLLVGDTSAVEAPLLDDMRRSGLLHFVAVSGGNVAIFLGAVWLALGLIPFGPRTRALVGLAATGVFVLATRWEPSVVRAGLMVGLLLAGRLGGVPVDGWTALGATVTLLMLVAPQLVLDIGFQLSVLATGGLLLGAHLWAQRRPVFFWRTLGATVAAQLAVTPLLLVSFGSVPAFAPVANVLAAPAVTLATAAGWGTALTGAPGVGRIAELAASWVIGVARWAATLPQVGVTGLVAFAGWLAMLRWRTSVGLTAAIVALLAVSMPVPPVVAPTAVFLDVGQGDATLLQTPAGRVVAIDTGPDPLAYAAALRRHGVSHIDLLVLTHADRDHTGGLVALTDRVPVERVWRPDFTPATNWGDVLRDYAGPVTPVRRGHVGQVGDFRLMVVNPHRRYATDNDGSIVLWVEVGRHQLLLPGDIEAVAQADLPELKPDVILVPHHGSRTTDLAWLRRTLGTTAILSYGDNDFGHPAPEVVALLSDAAAEIRHTAHGDVVLRFPADPQAAALGEAAGSTATGPWTARGAVRSHPSSAAMVQARPNAHGRSRFV